MQFATILGNALLSDYYNSSFLQLESGKLGFMVHTRMKDPFTHLFDQIGCKYDVYEHEGEENFLEIEFPDESSKDKADEYFTNFNFSLRTAAMIAKPDLYEGNPSPINKLCEVYRFCIYQFFTFEWKQIFIPIGADDGIGERRYMIYTQEGMVGQYPQSVVFRGLPNIMKQLSESDKQ